MAADTGKIVLNKVSVESVLGPDEEGNQDRPPTNRKIAAK